MKDRVLRCYARGRADRWEAMCIDLDIAVEAGSRTEVARALEEAVEAYVRAALQEEPKEARRLMSRRAPWWVRMRIIWDAFLHLGLRRQDEYRHAGFDLMCHA